MKSIERSIGIGLMGSLLLALATLAWLAENGVQRISEFSVQTRLEHDSDSLIRALSRQPDGLWQLDTQHLPPIYQRVHSGHYFQVIAGHQRFLSRSLWDRSPTLEPLVIGESHLQHLHSDGEHWLVWHQGIEYQDTPLTLWLAEDITPLERQWRHYAWSIYGVMLVTLVALVGIQHLLLRRSFRPLGQVQQAIHQLQQGEIASLSSNVPVEIQPLVGEINRLVDRLQQRSLRSRTAVGDLAHELKRNLQQLQPLAAQLPEPLSAEFTAIEQQIHHLMERELKRARIAGAPQPGAQFRPDDDLSALTRLLGLIYPRITVEVALESPARELPFDRDDLLELLGNLLDNACKHARQRVCLSIASSSEACLLRVFDDGEGIDPRYAQAITERGTKLDERRQGYGLGLSLCQMIVDSYGGQLAFADAPSGGCEVCVTLPFPG